jgi:hypothetical protein
MAAAASMLDPDRLRLFRIQVSAPARSVTLLPCLVLSGCDVGGSPSYSIFGAHFPASLLCAGAGLLGTGVFRIVLVSTGIEELVPARLLVYAAFATSLGIWMWLALFGSH